MKLGEGGGAQKVATVNLIIGGAAVAAGLYRLISLADEPAAESASSSAGLAISPLVIPTSEGTRFGLAMQLGHR